MKKLWLTYAWDDNKNRDVDFLAQEIEKTGIKVRLDRWEIQAGGRLWEQIDKFISSPQECDAWAIVLTQNSLGSEPCKEEIAYALDRALKDRGNDFRLIGISLGTVDHNIIPSVIRTRLYVSLTDKDWVERVKSAVEGTSPAIPKPSVDPFTVDIKNMNGGYVVELRPRAGSWSPFFIAVPPNEYLHIVIF